MTDERSEDPTKPTSATEVEAEFSALLAGMRAGDAAAHENFMERFGPGIRVIARRCLRCCPAPLGRQMDSFDVMQSVTRDYFVAFANGHHGDLTLDETLRLLSDIARRKVLYHQRRHSAERRDARRVLDVPVEELELAIAAPPPDEIVEREELRSSALKRLSPEERQLLTWRVEGRTWRTIAAQLGGRADRLSKKLRRALERIRSQLDAAD